MDPDLNVLKKDHPIRKQPPIVIAGVGGSGTRVVAQILMDLGFYLGRELNHANDNLFFTLLLRRGRVFRETAAQPGGEAERALETFTRLQFGLPLDTNDRRGLQGALLDQLRIENPSFRQRPSLWPLRLALRALFAKGPDPSVFQGWGWKEPNAHVYLELIDRVFPACRYIHTVRNGLDMAFSRNQQQLFRWGDLVGVPPPEDVSGIPAASLKYWVRANRQAVTYGQQMGSGRFLLLNFDRLCLAPRDEMERILGFLGLMDPDQIDALCRLPKIPRTMGRYKQHDLTVFDPNDMEALREFGFDLDL